MFFYIKENSYSHKLRHERYLELIYRYMLDDMYTKLTHMKISYVILRLKITCVYRKAHVIVV